MAAVPSPLGPDAGPSAPIARVLEEASHPCPRGRVRLCSIHRQTSPVREKIAKKQGFSMGADKNSPDFPMNLHGARRRGSEKPRNNPSAEPYLS